MQIGRPYAGRKGAFTLLEMLLSLALLSILVITTTQLINGTATFTKESKNRMSADAQARLVFDCMANDFSRIIQRRDVDLCINKQNGNDSIFFFSEVPGYYASSDTSSIAGVSLVGYRINTSNQLERIGKGLTWTGNPSSPTPGSVKYLTFTGTTADSGSRIQAWWPVTSPTTTGTDPDFQVLAPGVYRLEISFLLTNGTYSSKPYIPPHTSADGLADVSAIIVSLGILDETSRRLVSDFKPAIAALPDAVEGQPVIETWGGGNYLTSSGIPRTAASQLRIYQRFFYIKN